MVVNVFTHTIFRIFFWLCALIFSQILSANTNTGLDVSVDRTEIGINETFALNIVSRQSISGGFGSSPDLSGLEQDFEIIDTQQSTSMQFINGRSSSIFKLNLALAPKRTGKLTIPSITYNGESSKPIEILVNENNTPPSIQNPPYAFVEFSADKEAAYVQEQVIVSIKLYTRGRVSNGSLSEPESSKAIIEPFGEDQRSYEMVYKQRYQVLERKYLVFPQESGQLEFEPIVFNGLLIDSYARNRIRAREQSKPLAIAVNSPPPSFTGKDWLPAMSLHLEQEWDHDNTNIKVGDAITRRVNIHALGLLGSALPPLAVNESEIFKTYPDKPDMQSVQHESGAQSKRTESITYVAIKPGQLSLPEIEIKWWDTTNDVERVARLPAKTINVSGSNQTQQSIDSRPSKTYVDIVDDAKPSLSSSANNNDTSEGVSKRDTSLLLLLGLTILGWVISSWFLISKLRQQKSLIKRLSMTEASLPQENSNLYKDLIQAIKQESNEISILLLKWFAENNLSSTRELTSIEQLKYEFPIIYEQLKTLESNRFGKSATGAFNKELTLKEIETIKGSIKGNQESKKSNGLQAFYPS